MKVSRVERTFQAYKNDVYLLPNEHDEKMLELHFLTLNFRFSGS